MKKKAIILKILEGLNENSKLLRNSELGITEELWSEVIQILIHSDMIFGINIRPFGNKGEVSILGVDTAKISILGIEYLENNIK
ncbi:YjcQ family protein [Clostridium sp.]|uniref:YjcQ family protein n=1 Tax=Clostridium sp. TaxID=1506 RepID=UPI0026240A4D|nr:YjcQ family protein [Clostridium sp.]